MARPIERITQIDSNYPEQLSITPGISRGCCCHSSRCRITRYQRLKDKGGHDDSAPLFVVSCIDNMAIIRTIWQGVQNCINLKIKINIYFISNYKFLDFVVYILLCRMRVYWGSIRKEICYECTSQSVRKLSS